MFFKETEPTQLDAEMTRAFSELETRQPGTKEYTEVLDHVMKLHKLYEAEKVPNRLNADTMAVIASNILVTVLIIRHENVNVITSKALSFINKPKTPQF